LLKVQDVDQRQRAHDDIHRIIRHRQPVKLTEAELTVRDTPPRSGEHVRSTVDTNAALCVASVG
jgi:hypothetical protein